MSGTCSGPAKKYCSCTAGFIEHRAHTASTGGPLLDIRSGHLVL